MLPSMPTDSDIALAKNVALSVMGGDLGRARHVAWEALREVFDGGNTRTVAAKCGYPVPANAAPLLANARRTQWWDDEKVGEVVGALVAPLYGDQAA